MTTDELVNVRSTVDDVQAVDFYLVGSDASPVAKAESHDPACELSSLLDAHLGFGPATPEVV